MIETTSLELSKKLAGILEDELNSLMTWSVPMAPRMDRSADHRDLRFRGHKSKDMAAYTACELMKVLPPVVNGSQLTLWAERGKWDVDYFDEYRGANTSYMGAMRDTPAEALGEMVLWLHEAGLLK